MAIELTLKQKQQISESIQTSDKWNSCLVVSSWDPNLHVTIDGTDVVFDASDRSVSVGVLKQDGSSYSGAGFTNRMVEDAFSMLSEAKAKGEAPSPSKENDPLKGKSSSAAPPPPSRGVDMNLEDKPAPKKLFRVEHLGKIYHSKA